MEVEVPPQYLVDIRKSANQPLLWFGCEPTAFIALAMVAGGILFSLWGKDRIMLAIFVAALFFFVCFKVLQMYGEKDPIYLTVYLKNLKYKHGFWTAKPSHYKGGKE